MSHLKDDSPGLNLQYTFVLRERSITLPQSLISTLKKFLCTIDLVNIEDKCQEEFDPLYS